MLKILAVDQDLYILERYKELFAKAGFETHIAQDAISAISKFGEVKPDIVILDVEMPGGGGKIILGRLRANFMSKTPVLFATADPAAVLDLCDDPDVYVVKKEFLTQYLPNTIKTILKIE